MIETMELKPRIAIRDSAAFRGLVFGSALAAGFALCYLTLFLVIGVFVAPIIGGYSVNIDLFTGAVAVMSGAVGFVAGVLPAAVAGAVAGCAIGALLPVIMRRRGPKRAAGDHSPGRPDRSRSTELVWVWLAGTATTCLVGTATVIIIASMAPELIWTAEGLPIVWIPVLIFTVTGGPFALWLRGHSTRRASTERPVQPRRAAIPESARRDQAST